MFLKEAKKELKLPPSPGTIPSLQKATGGIDFRDDHYDIANINIWDKFHQGYRFVA